MLLFLGILLVVCVLSSHPVTKALMWTVVAAFIAFALLPFGGAWVITALVAFGAGAGAVDELKARREWRRGDELLRQAILGQARREINRL